MLLIISNSLPSKIVTAKLAWDYCLYSKLPPRGLFLYREISRVFSKAELAGDVVELWYNTSNYADRRGEHEQFQ